MSKGLLEDSRAGASPMVRPHGHSPWGEYWPFSSGVQGRRSLFSLLPLGLSQVMGSQLRCDLLPTAFSTTPKWLCSCSVLSALWAACCAGRVVGSSIREPGPHPCGTVSYSRTGLQGLSGQTSNAQHSWTGWMHLGEPLATPHPVS